MDENHQDKTASKLIATEDVRWEVNKKSKLWVPKHKKSTGFEDKTLWDKLNLLGTLAIPVILALATIGFGLWQGHLADLQHQQDQQLADMQHQQDQQQALDQQRAIILQTYIDNIQDLLLNHNLLKSSPSDLTNPYYDVAVLAQARTLTALHGLNPERKGLLLIFLHEANLIGFINTNRHIPIIALYGADLHDADLRGADLSDAIDLAQQQLDQVYTCKGAILPPGLTCHQN